MFAARNQFGDHDVTRTEYQILTVLRRAAAPGRQETRNNIMRNLIILTSAALLLLSGTGVVWADDGAEATIRLMGKSDDELPQAVTKELKLPEHLLEVSADEQVKAVEKATQKLNDAQAHRDEGRAKGQNQAAESRGRGQEMAEQAKQDRENHGRSEDPPGPPENPNPNN
jgi:hypothetical protein